MNENEKAMNFNETDDNGNVTNSEVTTPQVEVKKKGFLARFHALKWWQKAMILAGGATLIYIGGKWVFKAFETPEETVAETVQEAVNTVVETATESVEETAPF